MKRQWQLKNPDRLNTRPNVLIGANAHICVYKFADYFDIEARVIPVSERTRYTFDVTRLEENLDGNTSMNLALRMIFIRGLD
jgi:glutamate decarboxylase